MNRKFEASVSNPYMISPKENVTEATKREAVTFVWNGREITEMVSPGQVINKQKAYIRLLKREQEERIAKRKLLK